MEERGWDHWCLVSSLRYRSPRLPLAARRVNEVRPAVKLKVPSKNFLFSSPHFIDGRLTATLMLIFLSPNWKTAKMSASCYMDCQKKAFSFKPPTSANFIIKRLQFLCPSSTTVNRAGYIHCPLLVGYFSLIWMSFCGFQSMRKRLHPPDPNCCIFFFVFCRKQNTGELDDQLAVPFASWMCKQPCNNFFFFFPS